MRKKKAKENFKLKIILKNCARRMIEDAESLLSFHLIKSSSEGGEDEMGVCQHETSPNSENLSTRNYSGR